MVVFDTLHYIPETDNMLSIKHLCAALLFTAAFTPPSSAGTHLSETIFTAIDIETTGLSPSKDRIIEVSTIRFRGTNILERRSWLIDPGIPIPPRAAKIHGITDEAVRGKPAFEEVCRSLSQSLSNSVVIAHNARFDWNFIKSEYQKTGTQPPGEMVTDSIPLARAAFPGLDSYSLPSLAQSLKMDVLPTHRAESDALTLVALIQKSIAALGEKAQTHILKSMQVQPASNLLIPEKGLKESAE